MACSPSVLLKLLLQLIGVALVLSGCNATSEASPKLEVASQTEQDRPNFLIIVADDLGFSDLGITGSEIHTPNLDELARKGLLLTNFYSGGTCSPTRAMLLTGVDHHRAGLGNMIEHIAPNQVDQPGYEGFLNDRVVTLPVMLRDAGYRTYAAGKWHLGMTNETSPAARGFEKSFMLLNGGASHFDQRGLNGRSDPARYRENGEAVDLPPDFGYSTDFYTRKMISYLKEERDSGKPFFVYLAYTAPHWPLQAPKADIAKYKGVYDNGWESIQEDRRSKLVAAKLLPETTVTHPIQTESPAWTALTDDERRTEARKMEIYAAMIDRLDQQIGKLLDYLKDSGQFDNTMIVFMSDNGAEGAPLHKIPNFKKWMDSFDNSYDNMGDVGSYVYYEERWAQVSMTPFRLYKGMASDGGVHVPAIVNFGGLKTNGNTNTSVTSVMDITPTILELAGVPKHKGQYKGRNVYPIQGVSWASMLTGKTEKVRTTDEGIAFELFNKRGYRSGRWKALHLHAPFGPDEWQLFDISIDPGETKDLANKHPDILANLIVKWQAYANDNGVVLGSTPPER